MTWVVQAWVPKIGTEADVVWVSCCLTILVAQPVSCVDLSQVGWSGCSALLSYLAQLSVWERVRTQMLLPYPFCVWSQDIIISAVQESLPFSEFLFIPIMPFGISKWLVSSHSAAFGHFQISVLRDQSPWVCALSCTHVMPVRPSPLPTLVQLRAM